MTTEISEEIRAVCQKALDEEAADLDVMSTVVSGAHAYGFPSVDSDVDLRGTFFAPTESFLGLQSPTLSYDWTEFIDGLEVDFSVNEISVVLGGILRGDGNFLERILGPIVVTDSEAHEELVPLVRGSLSKRFHRHYRGFGRSLFSAFAEAGEPTVKSALYVFRTALTGVHLLRAEELVTDLGRLSAHYDIDGIDALIERKSQAERTTMSDEERESWTHRLEAVFDQLDRALEGSDLPEEPKNAGAVEGWLIEQRLERRG